MANKKTENIDTPMTVELFNASTANEVFIGGSVDSVAMSEGKPKKDKEGNPMYDDNTGVALTWNDSYYAEFSFKGGVQSLRITPEQYSNLKVGGTYQFVGRVVMKVNDGGRSYPTIEMVRMDFLF